MRVIPSFDKLDDRHACFDLGFEAAAQASELETIQRYETAIKRDMYRAIDQLEHLQRRRRGEPPPPTVNVNVSNDDDD